MKSYNRDSGKHSNQGLDRLSALLKDCPVVATLNSTASLSEQKRFCRRQV